MNIGEVSDWIDFLGNKYQSGQISATEKNLAFNVVSRELFNVKVGLPEAYQPGAPYPPQAWQVTQKITDDLRPFIKDLPISKVNGFFPIPTDYAAFSSLSYKYIVNNPDCGGDPEWDINFIDVLPDSEFRARLQDNVIMPTLKYPAATYRMQGILLKPDAITRIVLTYLRYPVVPVYAYTVVNDEYIYDPGNSVQIDFPETLHPEFAVRVARYAGINFREADFEQYMEARLAKGA